MTKAGKKVLNAAKTIDGTQLSHKRIESRLREIARLIEEHYGESGKTSESAPLIVQVLFGAFVIYPMLLTKFSVDFPTYVGAIRAKSYRENGVRSGVEITNPMFDCELDNKRILIIDDIVESGQTLLALKKWFEERGVSDVRTFALLDKPTKRTFEIEVDWVGFQLEPEQWVVGLGLDDNNLYRHFYNVVVVSEPKPKAIGKPR